MVAHYRKAGGASVLGQDCNAIIGLAASSGYMPGAKIPAGDAAHAYCDLGCHAQNLSDTEGKGGAGLQCTLQMDGFRGWVRMCGSGCEMSLLTKQALSNTDWVPTSLQL